MEFKALIRAEDRLSGFGVSAIFHKSQQKMAEWHCGDLCIAKDTAGKGYMGKKDLAGKEFFADRERFAELLNAVLYHGKNIIRAEELELMIRSYPSFSGKGEMCRDLFMKDEKRNVYYGLELETESDYSMPERVMVYDACEQEQQIREMNKARKEEEQLSYREKKSRMKETDFLLPVVTVVLYLGTAYWEGRGKLSELYHVPEETEKLMGEMLPDYGFLLLEADYVNAEMLETDLREFFQAMQCRNDKEKLRELWETERFKNLKEEIIWTIALHLDQERLMPKIKEGKADMCKAIEEIFEDGKIEGRAEGLEMGIEKGRGSIIRNMIQQGLDEEFICRITGCSQQEFASAAES